MKWFELEVQELERERTRRKLPPHPTIFYGSSSIRLWTTLAEDLGDTRAINLGIAFRHPELSRRVVGLSGRYDLTRQIGPFPDLLDGYYDQDVYFQMPSHFIPNLTDAVLLDRLRALNITLAVGEDDPFCENTRNLSQALWDRGVPNHLAVWSGEAHRARDWRAMVRLYL